MLVPPRVTVLMATYNDEPFLGAAIDSVLAQTFANFDLLIVIDAATDRSRDMVERYRDSRIRLLENETNLGLAASLNRGLAVIVSEYVARLDGNDLCFRNGWPGRLRTSTRIPRSPRLARRPRR